MPDRQVVKALLHLSDDFDRLIGSQPFVSTHDSKITRFEVAGYGDVSAVSKTGFDGSRNGFTVDGQEHGLASGRADDGVFVNQGNAVRSRDGEDDTRGHVAFDAAVPVECSHDDGTRVRLGIGLGDEM